MKRFYILQPYTLEIVAGANISLRSLRIAWISALNISRDYSYAEITHLCVQGKLNLILLSRYEKAEKQSAKDGRAQALDRFVHNGHAFGGAHLPLLHGLHPQS